MKDVIKIVSMLVLILITMIGGMFIMDKFQLENYRFTIPWVIGFINFPMVYYMGIGYEDKKDKKKD